jgi:hypothetical protein
MLLKTTRTNATFKGNGMRAAADWQLVLRSTIFFPDIVIDIYFVRCMQKCQPSKIETGIVVL